MKNEWTPEEARRVLASGDQAAMPYALGRAVDEIERLTAELAARAPERSAVTALLDAAGYHYSDDSFPALRIEAVNAIAGRLAAIRAPADASLEARAKCCNFPSPSVHDGQPYCEACDTDLVPARAVDASRPGLTEEQARALNAAQGMLPWIDRCGGRDMAPEDVLAMNYAREHMRHAFALLRASRGETGPAPSWGEQAIAEHHRAAEVELFEDIGALPPADPPQPDRPSGLTCPGCYAATGIAQPHVAGLADVVAASAREPHADVVLHALHVSGGAAAIGVESPVRDPRVDYSADMRPAVKGGECSHCLHAPPLHEATCPTLRRPWCLKCDKPVETCEVDNGLRLVPRSLLDPVGVPVLGDLYVRATCHGETFERTYTAAEIREHGMPPMTFFGPPSAQPREPDVLGGRGYLSTGDRFREQLAGDRHVEAGGCKDPDCDWCDNDPACHAPREP